MFNLNNKTYKESDSAIAWFLEDDFDEHAHLFSGVVKTGYKITAYICSCGDISFIIDKEHQESHVCQKCANSTFYDARGMLHHSLNVECDFIKTLSISTKKELYFEDDREFLLHLYEIDAPIDFFFNTLKINNDSLSLKNEIYLKDDDTLIIHCYIDVPSSFDFGTSKVNYSKKSIYKLSTHKNSKIDFLYELPLEFFDNNIEQIFQEQSIKYAKDNNIFNITSIKDFESLLFFEWSYFLEYPFLKERILFKHKNAIEVMYNNYNFSMDDFTLEKLLKNVLLSREQKSIKKAVYKNWQNQLCYNDSYTSFFVMAFCETIEDVNILRRLIELDLELKYEQPFSHTVFKDFIVYLKRFYSQTQIYNLMLEFKHMDNNSIFEDTVFAFETILGDDENIEGFRKVACKAMAIHDEFVRSNIFEIRNYDYLGTVFNYTKDELNNCIKTKGYVVVLPKNSIELNDYGYKLKNCLINYIYRILDKKSLVYCFIKDEKVQFAVEIVDNKICQASGVANTKLSYSEQQVLDKWYKICYTEIYNLE